MRFFAKAWLVAALLALSAPSLAAMEPNPRLLWDFGSAGGQAGLSSADLRFEPIPSGGEFQLRLDSGTSYDWPSLYLVPKTPLDLSAFGELSFALRNVDSQELRVYCRIDSLPPGISDAKQAMRSTFSLLLSPGEQSNLRIRLHPLPLSGGVKATDFFGMNGQPWFSPEAFYTNKVSQIIIFVLKSPQRRHFELGSPVLQNPAIPAARIPARVFPLIDEFGQFKHGDWPGKTHSEAELAQRKADEATELRDQPRPIDWDAYGGWLAGPQLAASGKFATHKIGDRWWLVDPDGRLFFSQGVDVVDFGGLTIVDERHSWFDSLPWQAGGDFWGYSWSGMQNYRFGQRSSRTFNFTAYNLSRKYGINWKTESAKLAHGRLASWGLNTIGNWSDPRITGLDLTPYVACGESAGPRISASTGYWQQFPDVWDPKFSQDTRANLQQRFGSAVNDKWCIGFFVDNELSWGDSESLARAALASGPGQAAKQALVDFLQTRYPAIAGLNQAWGQNWPNWAALLADTKAKPGPNAHQDLEDFYRLTAQKYFRQVRSIVRELAPERLYLGCRFAESNPVAVAVAQEYCDVVSFNIYQFSPRAKDDLSLVTQKPVLIGEFHFGALDRGQFHAGLVPVADQGQRASAYSNYVRDCLSHPSIVGCHWFQYYDEPTLGRALDGENYQIGFLDGVDTPYPELVRASRDIASQLYRLRSQDKP